MMGLQDREHFRKKYLQPAIQAGFVVMTHPDKPSMADQRYVLTTKGASIID